MLRMHTCPRPRWMRRPPGPGCRLPGTGTPSGTLCTRGGHAAQPRGHHQRRHMDTDKKTDELRTHGAHTLLDTLHARGRQAVRAPAKNSIPGTRRGRHPRMPERHTAQKHVGNVEDSQVCEVRPTSVTCAQRAHVWRCNRAGLAKSSEALDVNCHLFELEGSGGCKDREGGRVGLEDGLQRGLQNGLQLCSLVRLCVEELLRQWCDEHGEKGAEESREHSGGV